MAKQNSIRDYGLIGDGRTAALVSRAGAIDWLCLPFLDSPSVFAAILDAERGGTFRIAPRESFDSVQGYIPDTNVLRTAFRTRDGDAEIVDAMPVGLDEADRSYPGMILRRVQGLRGALTLEVLCAPRFDYARETPVCEPGTGGVIFRGTASTASLYCSRELSWEHGRTTLLLREGDVVWFAFHLGAPQATFSAQAAERWLNDTLAYWRDWLREGRYGRYAQSGFWRPILDRSALVLKLLQMRDSGAVAAAATTSLPAILFGERNWDYRFNWIRDASMTVATLFELGHRPEAERYLGWLRRICTGGPNPRLDIVYCLREPVPPHDEAVLAHLHGHRGSAPVRIGQYVVRQRQHDIYGELLETVFLASRYLGVVTLAHWEHLAPLVDEVIRIWREPDDGIWEARIGRKHYTHSKLMCWVAIDRAIKVAERYGFAFDRARWEKEREAIREDILAHGFNRERNTFTQHYDTANVDAALLLIPISGLLPVDDARVAGTVRAIEQDLLRDSVLLRYVADDGLAGQEMGFMICLFWYLECLLLQGRLHEVENYLREMRRYTNHLGLFAEQYDPVWQEPTGNFPQAYSHIGYATVLMKYLDACRPLSRPPRVAWLPRWFGAAALEVLNDTPEDPALAPGENPAEQVKRTMNLLRGHYYDGHAQRVRYELIRDSPEHSALVHDTAALRLFDLSRLADDTERVAFWVNLYNALVIHGVVHLGVVDSVREMPGFFRRIGYRVGTHVFAADDIEHGILRANARPPGWRLRRFRAGDPRRRFAVTKTDPRIHFALVCASKTCPPIEIYTADALDQQLDTSATVFINGSSRFDPAHGVLHVSEIFRWYRADFGVAQADIPRYVAPYLYDEALARALDAGRAVRVAFSPYDWRLNR